MVIDLRTALCTGTVHNMAFWKKSPPPAPSLLEERLAALESAQRRLDSDMDDLWSRFKRWTGRENKRAAIDTGSPHEPPATGPVIDPVSAQIIARRRPRSTTLNGGGHA